MATARTTLRAGSASVANVANPRALALACQVAGIHSGQVKACSPGTTSISQAPSDPAVAAGVRTSAIAVVSITGITSDIGAGKGLS